LGLWHLILAALGVVFASSLDGFVTGMAYSIKGLRLSCTHYLIIGFCTGSLMGISMVAGTLIASALPYRVQTLLGGAILVGLGIWQIAQEPSHADRQIEEGLDGHAGSAAASAVTPVHANPASKRHGLIDLIEAVLAVLREPLKADKDLSGSIELGEAWILSIALGLDAFAAGLGASMAGLPMAIILIASLVSPAFVYLGTLAGRASGISQNTRYKQVLSGIILMGVGLLKAAGLL
jgi:putative sporulation protein YtaF